MGDAGYRVVPMRLFAAWEADRAAAASGCVPRVATMSLNRLTVMKALEPDTSNCFVIAVKLQVCLIHASEQPSTQPSLSL